LRRTTRSTLLREGGEGTACSRRSRNPASDREGGSGCQQHPRDWDRGRSARSPLPNIPGFNRLARRHGAGRGGTGNRAPRGGGSRGTLPRHAAFRPGVIRRVLVFFQDSAAAIGREGETGGRNETRAILSLSRLLSLSPGPSVAAEFAPRGASRTPIESFLVLVGVLFSDTRARAADTTRAALPRVPLRSCARYKQIRRGDSSRGDAPRRRSAHFGTSLPLPFSLSLPLPLWRQRPRDTTCTATMTGDPTMQRSRRFSFFSAHPLSLPLPFCRSCSASMSPRCHSITKPKAEDRDSHPTCDRVR